MSVLSLQRLDSMLRAAGIPIDGVSGSQGSVRVDYQASATTQQRTDGDAIVAAFDWSGAADATYAAQREKTAAAASFDRGVTQAGQASDRIVVALAQLMLDEFNAHTAVEASMLAAVAAAASLAELKTRFAAIVPVPQRTQAQLINAIKAKIAATQE
jgi:hypothetical protein